MRRYFISALLGGVMMFSVPSANADQWVDVGPTTMRQADFSQLQAMVEGTVPATDPGQLPVPEMVEVGVTSMPREEFTILAGLVRGDYQVDRGSRHEPLKTLDIGIVALTRSQWSALTRMVENGFLQQFNSPVSEGVAVK